MDGKIAPSDLLGATIREGNVLVTSYDYDSARDVTLVSLTPDAALAFASRLTEVATAALKAERDEALGRLRVFHDGLIGVGLSVQG